MSEIIANIIILTLLAISLISIKKYKLLGFVVAVALIGSDTDSAGLLYAIEGYLPYFKVLVRGSTLITFAYSIFCILRDYVSKKISTAFIAWYFIPLLLLSIIIVVVNLFRGSGTIVSLSELIWLGIPFFFIWSSGSIKNSSDKIFLKLIIYQAIIAIFILILGPYSRSINGVTYAYKIGTDAWKDLAEIVVNSSISFGNFNKYDLSVMKFAQFHNPNSLGVYSTVFLATSLQLWMTKKKKCITVVSSLFLFLVGIIGWFNSLTRGPIFMIALVYLVYLMGIIIKPKTYKRVFLILIILFLVIINLNSILSIVQYLFVSASDISVVSRLEGFKYAFSVISNNFLFGMQSSVNDAIPHILPLKIATYYGVPAAILITIPFIHLIITTIKVFMKDILNGKSERTLYPSMLVGVIIGSYLTNGVVVYVLFWVLLSEAIQRLGILGNNSITSK